MIMSWFWLILHPLAVLKKLGWWIMVLIPLEVLVGIANAVLRVPIPVSSLHTAILATMIGILSYALVRSMYENLEQKQKQQSNHVAQLSETEFSTYKKIPA